NGARPGLRQRGQARREGDQQGQQGHQRRRGRRHGAVPAAEAGRRLEQAVDALAEQAVTGGAGQHTAVLVQLDQRQRRRQVTAAARGGVVGGQLDQRSEERRVGEERR